MDKLEKYRSLSKKILTEYYEMANTQFISIREFEASDRLAFDEQRDQYLWFRFGTPHSPLPAYANNFRNQIGLLYCLYSSKRVG